MSAKVKLMSVISLFILMLGVLILGVFAVGSQTIHLDGNVNFNVGDKSLYVKDVRLKEDMSSDPVSLKETGRFMPGYINETLNMSLGDENINSYGSIMLYFDIINTVDSEGKSSMYTVSATTTQNGVTVSAVVDNTQGYIPAGTVAPEDITSSMAETATIVVTISGAEGTTVDLSQITITLTIYELEVYDFTFTINEDNTATLDTYTGEGGDVVIPSTFSTRVVDGQTQYISGNDYTVTAIAAGSSSNGPFYSAQSTLTSITIPETIKTIGNYAFYNCVTLTEINYNAIEANDLSSNYVFHNAGRDVEELVVNIGVNVKRLPNYIFGSNLYNYWGNITAINFAEGSACISIGNNAFTGLSSLQTITIPEGVTSIGSDAFRNCYSLTSITIPSSVININRNAFSDCFALAEVYNYSSLAIPQGTIDSSVGYLGEHAKVVYNASDLTGEKPETRITVVDNVQYYNYGDDFIALAPAVARGTLTEVTLNSRTTKINRSAFSDSSLTSITIPSSVTSIGNSTFRGCSNLGMVNFGENSQLTGIGDLAFYNCSSLTSITIPENVTSIGNSAFEYCYGLTEINYNATNANDLTSSHEVFSSAGELGTGIIVNIGANVIKLPNYIFSPYNVSSAPNITAVNFEEGSVCESIGDSAFWDCNSLTSITLPSSITSIGDSTFEGCSNLGMVNFGENSQLTGIGERAFYSCDNLASITIPENVTSIGDWAFAGCYALAEVYNYSNVTTNLPSYAKIIYNASDLSSGKPKTRITVANNVQYYDYGDDYIALAPAVARGTLTEVTLGNRTTEINQYAFSSCDSLTSITIPDSVTSIGSEAFSFCYNLVEVYNYSTSFTVSQGSSNSSVGNLGQYAKVVYNARDLSGGKPETRIRDYNGVRYYDDGENTVVALYAISKDITTVSLDSRTTEINQYAFNGCSSLTSITIPESVKSIGSHAFDGCNFTSATIDSSYAYRNAGGSYNTCGYLLRNPDTVYVKANLVEDTSLTASSYLTSNFTCTDAPNEAGYYVYTRN